MELLDVRATAGLLGQSQFTLYSALRQDRPHPPYFRVGKKYLFRREEVIQWLQDRHVDGVQ